MKKKINFTRKTLTTFFLLSCVACTSWLDLNPENDQVSSTYWNTKEDIEAVVIGGYSRLQGCLEKMLQWGEVRGDGMMLAEKATTSEQNLVMLQILTTNELAKWDPLYKVISSANAVIKYAPTVLDKDKSLTNEFCNAMIAEATFQRALCYFYLVRTFGEIPFVLEPYVDDSAPFMMAKTPEKEIISTLIADLERIRTQIKPGYTSEIENKGRATVYALNALLADLYLWDGQYDKVLSECDAIIQSGRFNLLDKMYWYELYNPGNSIESIFELQWTGTQSNSLYSWFHESRRYMMSFASLELFTQTVEVDYRGMEVSFLENFAIWKYIGTSAKIDGGELRETNERNANWIIYRLAEIVLMKAEALVMLERFDEANILYTYIRSRAGYLKHPVLSEKRQALELIMDERQMEFLGEGKRWFDILRVAKRNNYEYRDYLVDVLLDNTSAQNRPVFEAKLRDERGYYLPIHKKEIDANGGILIQNEYYKDVE